MDAPTAPIAFDQQRLRDLLRQLPPPEPAAGTAAYVRERELALAANEAKRRNYDLYQHSSRRDASPDYLPIKLDFENVSRCNFRCTMCTVSDWKKGKRADDMKVSDFKKLIDEQYGLVEIKIQGLGETTMQGDDFFEMIRYARSQHIWVRTTTNASLLHLHNNAEKLIDADPNEVQISIDGATKEVFEGIRRGSVFDQVVKNCKIINDYSAKKGVVRTKMWTVLQKSNYYQMKSLIEIAADTGFQHHTFSLELVDFGLDRWAVLNNACSVEDKMDPDNLLSMIDYGKRLGVEIRFWNTTAKYDTSSPETLCPWPFERAFVSSDLRVVPCCMISNPDVFAIGTENLGSFTEAWRGKAFTAFRRSHLDGHPPRVCQGCYRADESLRAGEINGP